VNEIAVVLPERSDSALAEALCSLTARLQGITGEGPHGILGGPDGYGCEYENDVFMMHPFCWCERGDCPWCYSCECPNEYKYYNPAGDEISEAEFDKLGLDDYPDGSRFDAMVFVGQQCSNCAEPKKCSPNFLFKPTGASVSWYKYIGRSMEVEGRFPPDFLNTCFKSLVQS